MSMTIKEAIAAQNSIKSGAVINPLAFTKTRKNRLITLVLSNSSDVDETFVLTPGLSSNNPMLIKDCTGSITIKTGVKSVCTTKNINIDKFLHQVKKGLVVTKIKLLTNNSEQLNRSIDFMKFCFDGPNIENSIDIGAMVTEFSYSDKIKTIRGKFLFYEDQMISIEVPAKTITRLILSLDSYEATNFNASEETFYVEDPDGEYGTTPSFGNGSVIAGKPLPRYAADRLSSKEYVSQQQVAQM